jgi:anti-sigma B factor antagonist
MIKLESKEELMQINSRIVKDIMILDIFGEFELYESSKIKEIFEQKIKEKYKKFVINLENVTYVDSSGIKTLIACEDIIIKLGGELKLVNVQGSIRRIFELTKLINFFPISNSESEAINSLSGL